MVATFEKSYKPDICKINTVKKIWPKDALLAGPGAAGQRGEKQVRQPLLCGGRDGSAQLGRHRPHRPRRLRLHRPLPGLDGLPGKRG